MSIAITHQTRSFKKVLLIGIAAAVVLAAAGYMATRTANHSSAAKASDYGLQDGNRITAYGAVGDPDIFIVKEDFQMATKRNFQNAVICNFYGQFGVGGCFAKGLKQVNAATRDAFPTSCYYTNAETKDGKVWFMQATGPDSGTLRAVQVSGAAAIAADPLFFNKVFNMNTLEQNWYPVGTPITDMTQVPVCSTGNVMTSSTPTPVAGAINVSLSPANPAAGTITKNAQGVEVLRMRLSGTGTISTMTVKRTGAGATGDITNVYLYDGATRLVSGRSISSATGDTTFVNLNTAVSGTKDLSIVVDFTGTAGNVHQFQVTAVGLTSGTVSGVPVSGNNFTVAGSNGGTITVAKTGNLGNPNVGQSNVEMSQFQLTTATEAASLKRITLLNGGTMKSSDFKNLMLKTGTNSWPGVMTTNDYMVFDMGSGFTIAKGNNAIFSVFGDVGGKKSETIKLYFESTTDILGIGDQFGFGMAVTNTVLNTSALAHSLTLQGGVLTLSFIGPSASNISTNVTKVHFLDFDVNAASAIEIKKHTIILCQDNTSDGTYDAASDTTNRWGDVTNISIIDRDTGVSLISAQDGSAFLLSNTSCPGGVTGAAKQFTDTININAGQTLHLAVVGDVNTSNTGGIQLTGSSSVKAIIDGYGDAVGASGDTTILKYSGTNTGLVNTDVVPAGDISGNTMALQSSSLTLSLGASPNGNNTYVQGTQNVSAVGFNFTAALGNPITVNTVTLTGYVADSGTTLVKGVASAPDASLNVGRLAAQVRLVDSTNPTVTLGTLSTNNLTTTTGTVQFTGMNWAIPAGATKTLLVKTDLSTIPVSGSSDVFSFDIVATTDVTAVDARSTSINAANATVNGTTTPTTYTTVSSVGVLTPTLAPSAQTKSAVYWGQNVAPFSTFRFTSQNEGFFIERLNVMNSGDTAGDLTNNLDSVTVTYLTKGSAVPVSKTQTLNSAASTSFGFSGTDRPYVPKDGVLDVTVTANVRGVSFFRAADKNFSLDFSGGNADEFRAVGEGSGTVIDGATAATIDVLGNNLYVYRSFPQFTALATGATTITAGQDVFKFKVDSIGFAPDGATVFFDGATANTSGSMKFAVLASGAGATTTAISFHLRRVVDEQGISVDQLVASRSLTSGTDTDFNNNSGLPASLSMRFRDVAGNQSIEIPAGKSNTFILRLNTIVGFTKPLNTNTGRSADYLQVQMKDNENNLIYWTDKGGVDRNNSNGATTGVLRQLPMIGPRINFQ